jgi:hypothetical protein
MVGSFSATPGCTLRVASASPELPDHHHGPHMPQSIWEYWAAHASSAAI